MNEVWKATKYEGYEVSNLGRLRSYWRPRGLDLSREPRIKSVVMNNGRAKVSICSNGKNTLTIFSRIVAEAFLGMAEGRIVLYRDKNPENCSADNLYYATRGDLADERREIDYQIYGDYSSLGREMKIQRQREEHLARALRCEALRQDGKTYREIGKEVGISESGAFRIVNYANNQMLRKAHYEK